MEQTTPSQAEDKNKSGWELKPEIIVGFIGVVIFIAFIVFVSKSASPTSDNNTTVSEQDAPSNTPSPTPDDDLKVEIHAFDFSKGIEVINKEGVDVSDCILKLNDSYTYNDPLLDKNADTTIPYGWFTKDDGTRFDIGKTAAKSVYINCSVNGNTKSNYFAGK